MAAIEHPSEIRIVRRRITEKTFQKQIRKALAANSKLSRWQYLVTPNIGKGNTSRTEEAGTAYENVNGYFESYSTNAPQKNVKDLHGHLFQYRYDDATKRGFFYIWIW